MKKLSIISMIVGCLAAMCLTSCNDSDAPKVLTPEELQSAFMTVKICKRDLRNMFMIKTFSRI